MEYTQITTAALSPGPASLASPTDAAPTCIFFSPTSASSPCATIAQEQDKESVCGNISCLPIAPVLLRTSARRGCFAAGCTVFGRGVCRWVWSGSRGSWCVTGIAVLLLRTASTTAIMFIHYSATLLACAPMIYKRTTPQKPPPPLLPSQPTRKNVTIGKAEAVAIWWAGAGSWWEGRLTPWYLRRWLSAVRAILRSPH